MMTSDEEFESGDDHPNNLDIISLSLLPRPRRHELREAEEVNNGDNSTSIHGHKRKSIRVAHINPKAKQDRHGKRINLSMKKPQTQRMRFNKLRSQHRDILRRLLHKLVSQHNWVEASGVLSVYLRATLKDSSPLENQFKYSVLLKLLEHTDKSNITSRKIESIYDVWMGKNGKRKDGLVKEICEVPLNFILFCMMQGNFEEAHKVVQWHKQENNSFDSITNMVMGLVYYELWYACIPKECQWRGSKLFGSPGTSYEGEKYFSSEEELDAWQFLLHIRDLKSFENSIPMNNKQSNYYKESVGHLRKAIDSSPSKLGALVPLMQLLLIEGNVDEAFNILEKQCCASTFALPFRLKAILLERFKSTDSSLLASCFEATLKKDPTCCESLAKLVKMHEDGNYSVESLVEMIALHLQATNAEHSTWKQFADCFFRLSDNEPDCGPTTCLNNKNGYQQQNSSSKSSSLKVFTEEVWRVRFRWWSYKYFCLNILRSDIKTGDLQLLTYKAACASYIYGEESPYVQRAYSHLKETNQNLLGVLNNHKQKSYGFYK